jgi:hypothetical protein
MRLRAMFADVACGQAGSWVFTASWWWLLLSVRWRMVTALGGLEMD